MGSALHTRTAKATPKQSTAEIFRQISDEEAYENGHSYSGTFGSKDSVRGFKVNMTPRQFKTVRGLIIDLHYNGTVKPKAQSIEDRALNIIGRHNLTVWVEIVADKFGPALSVRNHNGDILFIGECSE